jgi:hypothetical protein
VADLSFNDFIKNIADYYNDISTGTIRPFHKDAPYPAQDLQDQITKSEGNPHPDIVAGAELGLAYKRSNMLRTRKPQDYFQNYKKSTELRSQPLQTVTQANVNAAQGEGQ